MSRIAYVNGRYVPHQQAAVHVEDRGYQFADGVYEVIPVRGGRLVDRGPHLDRLDRSLGELRIAWPMSRGALSVVLDQCIRRNRVSDGIVYLQMTRGVARRDHAIQANLETSLVVTARNQTMTSEQFKAGIRVVTIPDIRWKRCDIKSISLLPNVLAKQAAKERGAYEAWQLDEEGFITEGSSSNAWIVTPDGALVTRYLGASILSGITRLVVLDLAHRHDITLVERPFSRDEALAASEAFLTSTTSCVLPVVQIDDHVLHNGRPGSITGRLQALYDAHLNRPAADLAGD